jgi:hypothetical protein
LFVRRVDVNAWPMAFWPEDETEIYKVRLKAQSQLRLKTRAL